MKTIQLRFKSVLFMLLIGFIFTGCGSDKKDSEKDSDGDAGNLEPIEAQSETKTKELTSPDRSKGNNSRIAEEDAGITSPDSPEGNSAPIELDCNYFRENPNTILKDNPQAQVDYIIPCMTRIDGKLNIEPGVVIAFEQDAGLNFTTKSSFKMEGSAEKPIILIGKEQTKGYWRGVHTESPNANNKMSYVTVDYAGSSKAALEIYREKTNLSLDNCTFSNSKTAGMLVSDDVGKDVHNIQMNNCTFTKNNIPVKANVTRLRMFNGSNSFSGNEKDYIHIDRERLNGDVTWASLDVPYFLQDNFRFSDGVLTVEPGTEIIMSAQNWMHLSNKASLVMVGTEEDPIIIRGEHDVPGFWIGFTIDSSSPLNEISHVNFRNGGSTTGTPNGVVRLERSKFLKIHDVVFTRCFEYGLSLRSAPKSHLEYANLTLEDTEKLFSDWGGKELTNLENP